MATPLRSVIPRTTPTDLSRAGDPRHRGAAVRGSDLKWPKVLVSAETPISDTMRVIDREAVGFALVVDGDRRLLGVVSDGDIRKGLLAGGDAASPPPRASTRAPLGSWRRRS